MRFEVIYRLSGRVVVIRSIHRFGPRDFVLVSRSKIKPLVVVFVLRKILVISVKTFYISYIITVQLQKSVL